LTTAEIQCNCFGNLSPPDAVSGRRDRGHALSALRAEGAVVANVVGSTLTMSGDELDGLRPKATLLDDRFIRAPQSLLFPEGLTWDKRRCDTGSVLVADYAASRNRCTRLNQSRI
jgi:hypothetical protein